MADLIASLDWVNTSTISGFFDILCEWRDRETGVIKTEIVSQFVQNNNKPPFIKEGGTKVTSNNYSATIGMKNFESADFVHIYAKKKHSIYASFPDTKASFKMIRGSKVISAKIDILGYGDACSLFYLDARDPCSIRGWKPGIAWTDISMLEDIIPQISEANSHFNITNLELQIFDVAIGVGAQYERDLFVKVFDKKLDISQVKYLKGEYGYEYFEDGVNVAESILPSFILAESTDNYSKYKKRVSSNGPHTFYARNKEGSDRLVVHHVTSIAAFVPIPPTITTPDNWVKDDVLIKLTSKGNEGEGYDDIFYELSGATTLAEQKYVMGSEDLIVTNSGITTITAYVQNAEGNKSTVSTKEIKIDKTAPTLEHTITPDTWTKGNVTITVTGSDTQSGMFKMCKPDGQCVFGSAITFVATENGDYEFIATDNAGNETRKTISITNIDRGTPIITVSKSSEEVVPKLFVTIGVEDLGSGLEYISIKGEVQNIVDSKSFGIVLAITVNDIYQIYAKDKVGNESHYTLEVTNTQDAQVNPPIITITGKRELPCVVKPLVTLEQDPNDIFSSGIQYIEYMIEGPQSTDWSVYTGPFNIVYEGVSVIHARCVTNLNSKGHMATEFIETYYIRYDDCLASVVEVELHAETATEADVEALFAKIQLAIDKINEATKSLPLIPEFIQLLNRLNILKKYIEQNFVHTEVEPHPFKKYSTIFLLDTSSSMSGVKIKQLNDAMSKIITSLKALYFANDVDIDMRLIRFGDARFVAGFESGPKHIKDVTWKNLTTAASTPMGEAVRLFLNKALLPEFIPENLGVVVPPLLVLLSDGMPTNEALYYSVMNDFDKKYWGIHGDRVSVSVTGAHYPVMKRWMLNEDDGKDWGEPVEAEEEDLSDRFTEIVAEKTEEQIADVIKGKLEFVALYDHRDIDIETFYIRASQFKVLRNGKRKLRYRVGFSKKAAGKTIRYRMYDKSMYKEEVADANGEIFINPMNHDEHFLLSDYPSFATKKGVSIEFIIDFDAGCYLADVMLVEYQETHGGWYDASVGCTTSFRVMSMPTIVPYFPDEDAVIIALPRTKEFASKIYEVSGAPAKLQLLINDSKVSNKTIIETQENNIEYLSANTITYAPGVWHNWNMTAANKFYTAISVKRRFMLIYPTPILEIHGNRSFHTTEYELIEGNSVTYEGIYNLDFRLQYAMKAKVYVDGKLSSNIIHDVSKPTQDDDYIKRSIKLTLSKPGIYQVKIDYSGYDEIEYSREIQVEILDYIVDTSIPPDLIRYNIPFDEVDYRAYSTVVLSDLEVNFTTYNNKIIPLVSIANLVDVIRSIATIGPIVNKGENVFHCERVGSAELRVTLAPYPLRAVLLKAPIKINKYAMSLGAPASVSTKRYRPVNIPVWLNYSDGTTDSNINYLALVIGAESHVKVTTSQWNLSALPTLTGTSIVTVGYEIDAKIRFPALFYATSETKLITGGGAVSIGIQGLRTFDTSIKETITTQNVSYNGIYELYVTSSNADKFEVYCNGAMVYEKKFDHTVDIVNMYESNTVKFAYDTPGTYEFTFHALKDDGTITQNDKILTLRIIDYPVALHNSSDGVTTNYNDTISLNISDGLEVEVNQLQHLKVILKSGRVITYPEYKSEFNDSKMYFETSLGLTIVGDRFVLNKYLSKSEYIYCRYERLYYSLPRYRALLLVDLPSKEDLELKQVNNFMLDKIEFYYNLTSKIVNSTTVTIKSMQIEVKNEFLTSKLDVDPLDMYKVFKTLVPGNKYVSKLIVVLEAVSLSMVLPLEVDIIAITSPVNFTHNVTTISQQPGSFKYIVDWAYPDTIINKDIDFYRIYIYDKIPVEVVWDYTENSVSPTKKYDDDLTDNDTLKPIGIKQIDPGDPEHSIDNSSYLLDPFDPLSGAYYRWVSVESNIIYNKDYIYQK